MSTFNNVSIELYGVIKFRVKANPQEGVATITPCGYTVGTISDNDVFYDGYLNDVLFNVETYKYSEDDNNNIFYGFPIKLNDLAALKNVKLDSDNLPLYLEQYYESVCEREYQCSFTRKDQIYSTTCYSLSRDDQTCRIEHFKEKYIEKREVISQKKTEVSERREIIGRITKKIISQDRQVAQVVNTLLSNQKYQKYEGTKSNIILVGSTGTGKTEIARLLAKELSVPFVKEDATKFTSSGYVGRDIVSTLKSLYIASDKDLEKCERGIIYLDEFDKLSPKEGDNSSVRAESVQEELMAMVEGADYTVEISRDQEIKINTSKITFIFSGSFQKLFEKSNTKTMIGFNSESNSIQKRNITIDDLIDYGILREIVGRTPMIVQMKFLEKDDLKAILTTSEISNLRIWSTAFLEEDNVVLNCTPKAIDLIAEEAYRLGLGARSLQSIVERTLEDIKPSIMDGDLYGKEVIVTEDTVRDSGKYLVKSKKEGRGNELSKAVE